MIAVARDFEKELDRIFSLAQQNGKSCVEVKSGVLHRQVGGYPSRNHRMPMCCRVMREKMRIGDDVLQEPPSGQGANRSYPL